MVWTGFRPLFHMCLDDGSNFCLLQLILTSSSTYPPAQINTKAFLHLYPYFKESQRTSKLLTCQFILSCLVCQQQGPTDPQHPVNPGWSSWSLADWIWVSLSGGEVPKLTTFTSTDCMVYQRPNSSLASPAQIQIPGLLTNYH
jgi:hypothetical protein